MADLEAEIQAAFPQHATGRGDRIAKQRGPLGGDLRELVEAIGFKRFRRGQPAPFGPLRLVEGKEIEASYEGPLRLARTLLRRGAGSLTENAGQPIYVDGREDLSAHGKSSLEGRCRRPSPRS